MTETFRPELEKELILCSMTVGTTQALFELFKDSLEGQRKRLKKILDQCENDEKRNYARWYSEKVQHLIRNRFALAVNENDDAAHDILKHAINDIMEISRDSEKACEMDEFIKEFLGFSEDEKGRLYR